MLFYHQEFIAFKVYKPRTAKAVHSDAWKLKLCMGYRRSSSQPPRPDCDKLPLFLKLHKRQCNFNIIFKLEFFMSFVCICTLFFGREHVSIQYLQYPIILTVFQILMHFHRHCICSSILLTKFVRLSVCVCVRTRTSRTV